jgi:hypothetical protein
MMRALLTLACGLFVVQIVWLLVAMAMAFEMPWTAPEYCLGPPGMPCDTQPTGVMPLTNTSWTTTSTTILMLGE